MMRSRNLSFLWVRILSFTKFRLQMVSGYQAGMCDKDEVFEGEEDISNASFAMQTPSKFNNNRTTQLAAHHSASQHSSNSNTNGNSNDPTGVVAGSDQQQQQPHLLLSGEPVDLNFFHGSPAPVHQLRKKTLTRTRNNSSGSSCCSSNSSHTDLEFFHGSPQRVSRFSQKHHDNHNNNGAGGMGSSSVGSGGGGMSAVSRSVDEAALRAASGFVPFWPEDIEKERQEQERAARLRRQQQEESARQSSSSAHGDGGGIATTTTSKSMPDIQVFSLFTPPISPQQTSSRSPLVEHVAQPPGFSAPMTTTPPTTKTNESTSNSSNNNNLAVATAEDLVDAAGKNIASASARFAEKIEQSKLLGERLRNEICADPIIAQELSSNVGYVLFI